MSQPPYQMPPGYPPPPHGYPPPGFYAPTPAPRRSSIPGCLGAFALLALIGIGVRAFSDKSDARPAAPVDTTPRHLRPRTAADAWGMAKVFVKERLKAPDSADFGSAWDGDRQDPSEACKDQGGEVWVCRGWVKAQNAFGVKLRNRFRVVLEYKRDEKETWRVVAPGVELSE